MSAFTSKRRHKAGGSSLQALRTQQKPAPDFHLVTNNEPGTENINEEPTNAVSF